MLASQAMTLPRAITLKNENGPSRSVVLQFFNSSIVLELVLVLVLDS
jgi:hypothetical protein